MEVGKARQGLDCRIVDKIVCSLERGRASFKGVNIDAQRKCTGLS